MVRDLVSSEDGRSGGALTSATIALAFVCSAWFLWVLQSDVDAAEFTRVETADVRLDVGAGWADPRWETMVKEQVAKAEPFACDDGSAIEALNRSLFALPFVRSVDSHEAAWPDGLRITISMRMPIACIEVGREFLGISSDGMLLPGAWPAPPSRGQGFLPVLALKEKLTNGVRPGEVLWNDTIADGLSVASSMWAVLDAEDLALLGRVVIDASKARQTQVDEPGTLILMENSRRILFGRAPSTPEPGELPVEVKWLHVANALMCLPSGPPLEVDGEPSLGAGDVDWELVDVRWDHAEMLPRGGNPSARLPVKVLKTQKPKPAGVKPTAGAQRAQVR